MWVKFIIKRANSHSNTHTHTTYTPNSLDDLSQGIWFSNLKDVGTKIYVGEYKKDFWGDKILQEK